MERETAEIVLYALTAFLFLVWASGFAFLLRTSRPSGASAYPEEPRSGAASQPGWIAGEVEVAGEPPELAAAAGRALASRGADPPRILSATESEVLWEETGAMGAAWPAMERAGLRFLPGPSAGKTRVAFALRPRGRGFLTAAWIIQILGLVAIAAGFLLVRAFAVASEDPRVRWQVLQMLQAAHFLWPPFLFAALHRSGRKVLRRRIEAFVGNLTFLER